MSTHQRTGGHRWIVIVVLAVPIFIGACSTRPSSGLRIDNPGEVTSKVSGSSIAPHLDETRFVLTARGDSPAVCTPPRQQDEDETSSRFAALRKAPYRACQGYVLGRISRSEYQSFIADYSALLLIVTASETLEHLDADIRSRLQKHTLESLATANAALRLMCGNPDFFEFESECRYFAIGEHVLRKTPAVPRI